MSWSQILDELVKIFTILGISGGGLFALHHYLKSRVYKFKFEQNISGRIISIDQVEYLVISVSLINVGLSKIDIRQKGSGIELFACEKKVAIDNAKNVDWQYKGTFGVLEKHDWIESGETIQDELLIAIPKNKYIAFRAHFRIMANKVQRNAFKVLERPTTKEAPKKRSNQLNGKEESDA
jgi:hypothetical protein